MSSAHPVPLKAADGTFVEAVLYERVEAGFALQADDDWRAHLADQEARALAEGRAFPALEHDHWNWGEKVKVSAQLLSCPTLAIEFGGQAQGLMLIITDGHFAKLQSELGKPLLYVAFLATAPWNQRDIAPTPRFRGVGEVFMVAAVQLSMDVGFKGRVGLHSLPKSEGFYERCGFQCLGKDPDKQDLKYYELSPQTASELIARSTP